jgi:enoyl-CoA hydratase/carnithine racemase
MNYENLIVETVQDYTAEITLNRPDHLNTFDRKMAGELLHALLELDADQQVRVILIKGAGKVFCAGIDVKELSGKNVNQYRRWIEHMENPLVAISTMRTPVIAQVHGVAAANGMGLVAAADLAIASSDARMGLTAINVGLNCVGPVLPVTRCVGRKKALELLLYGKLIDAERALSMGLINLAVPKEELQPETRRWAAELAQKSPLAVQIAKSAFYQAEDMPYGKQFAHMNEAFARLCSTEDAKEGVAAFFGKRKPQWKER